MEQAVPCSGYQAYQIIIGRADASGELRIRSEAAAESLQPVDDQDPTAKFNVVAISTRETPPLGSIPTER